MVYKPPGSNTYEKHFQGVHLTMLQLCTEEESLLQALTTHADHQPSVLPSIQQLLDHFGDIFQEPSKLPPSRELHDHTIPLLEGSNPVNKRLYKYAKHQKDIIDGLIQEYLKSGIIQHSSSLFRQSCCVGWAKGWVVETVGQVASIT